MTVKEFVTERFGIEDLFHNHVQELVVSGKDIENAIEAYNNKQIAELKEKAQEVVDIYILTTSTEDESGSQRVISKLAKPIIELNEALKP